MNDWDSQDEVWKLLGQARPVKVSPYFSRRVLRDIRQVPAPRFPLFFRWALAGTFGLLALGFFFSLEPTPTSALAVNSPEFIQTFDEAAGLDVLVADTISADSSFPGL